MTEFKAPPQGRLDREDWPKEANDEWERAVDRGVPPALARQQVAREFGVLEEQPVLPDEIEAAQRLIGENSDTTTPSRRITTVEERAAAGARADKEISNQGKREAQGLDRPDSSHLDLSEEDKVLGDRNKNFVDGMITAIGRFDVPKYLEANPNMIPEAEELGFKKPD